MTAWQPDEEKLTAQQELGGRATWSDKLLADLGLRTLKELAAEPVDPKVYWDGIARRSAFGGRTPEDDKGLNRVVQGYRDQTLPGMPNSPEAVTGEGTEGPPTLEKYRAAVNADWDAVEERIKAQQTDRDSANYPQPHTLF